MRVCLAPSFPSVIWVSLIEKVILGLYHHQTFSSQCFNFVGHTTDLHYGIRFFSFSLFIFSIFLFALLLLYRLISTFLSYILQHHQAEYPGVQWLFHSLTLEVYLTRQEDEAKLALGLDTVFSYCTKTDVVEILCLYFICEQVLTFNVKSYFNYRNGALMTAGE